MSSWIWLVLALRVVLVCESRTGRPPGDAAHSHAGVSSRLPWHSRLLPGRAHRAGSILAALASWRTIPSQDGRQIGGASCRARVVSKGRYEWGRYKEHKENRHKM